MTGTKCGDCVGKGGGTGGKDRPWRQTRQQFENDVMMMMKQLAMSAATAAVAVTICKKT